MTRGGGRLANQSDGGSHEPNRQDGHGMAGVVVAAHAAAQIIFYDGPDFRGRAFATSTTVSNFATTGVNDQAASFAPDRGVRIAPPIGTRSRAPETRTA
jgi:hypothetical protein